MFSAEAYGDPGAVINRVSERAETAAAKVVFDTAETLLTQIRANASSGYHRPGAPHIDGTGPGPNVATGDYRRSWHADTGYDASGDPVALVSTNSPQAARLEYGFADTDSAGRTFNQPAYPHVRPAIEQVQPGFEQAIRTALRELS